MIKIEFLEQDLKTINEQRFSHPVPLVQRRMEAQCHKLRLKPAEFLDFSAYSAIL